MNSDVTERARHISPEYVQFFLTSSVGFAYFLFLILFQGSAEFDMIKALTFQTPQKIPMEDLMFNNKVLKKIFFISFIGINQIFCIHNEVKVP